mgnify:CR=1 FL=1
MRVRVRTPARLHFGLLELGEGMGRVYGGMGVAVEKPYTEISVESCESLKVEGDDRLIYDVVGRLAARYGVEPKVKIRILNSIPSHVGLGSRTQLTLAVATAFTRLFGVEATVEELAGYTGVGRVSSVGTMVFKKGGFVLDGGKRAGADGLPTILMQRPFPSSWAFTIVVPKGLRGPTEGEEENLFKILPKMSDERVGRLCRLTLVKLLPALVEEDILEFGKALTEIQRILGDYFSSVQGGVFANPYAEEITAILHDFAAAAVGQSSWGPSLYGLFPSLGEANSAAEKLSQTLSGSWSIITTSACNTGAEISVTSQPL